MFERPTPSLHHLSKTHRWEGNTVILTLPSSLLSSKNSGFKAEKLLLSYITISVIIINESAAAGVGYLALLNAEFAKASGRKHVSEQVGYCLRVDSSVCQSWDAQQASWTHTGCRTLQTDVAAAVNCR